MTLTNINMIKLDLNIDTVSKWIYVIFFENIDRDLMMDKLRHVIKDKKMLKLCKNVINSAPGDRGLPLGYYTSQWFANFFLQGIDRINKQYSYYKSS